MVSGIYVVGIPSVPLVAAICGRGNSYILWVT